LPGTLIIKDKFPLKLFSTLKECPINETSIKENAVFLKIVYFWLIVIQINISLGWEKKINSI